MSHRPLYLIALEIERDWGAKVFFGAVPYINTMKQLDTINDRFYADDARTMVYYFLGNARGWRGEKAKAIKAELKGMLK